MSVSGIGPKTALGILNVSDVATLRRSIAAGDAAALTKVCLASGKKSAERLVVELRDKLALEQTARGESTQSQGGDSEVIEALGALGYSLAEARGALKHIGKTGGTVNERISAALKALGSTRHRSCNLMKRLLKKIIPASMLGNYHYSMAMLGALYYRFPSRKLFVIGITGTKGKSTTTELMAAILQEAGIKVAVASTIRFAIGSESEPNLFKMTMPGRFFLQRFLRKAVNAGATHAIVEMTSEGANNLDTKASSLMRSFLLTCSPSTSRATAGSKSMPRPNSRSPNILSNRQNARAILWQMPTTHMAKTF